MVRVFPEKGTGADPERVWWGVGGGVQLNPL